MKININTQDGTNQITTNKIKGELKGLVIFSPDKDPVAKINVEITSELGYTLFKYPDIEGTQYFSLSSRMIDNEAHLVNQWVPYYVDEKLKIVVQGPKDKEIQIILKIV